MTDVQRRNLLLLARQALTARLREGKEPAPVLWSDPVFDLPAAVFVTLRRRGRARGESLRGCIGSLAADLPLAEAVERYAVASGLEDSRFSPVTKEELPDLFLEISRLSPFRRVRGHEEVRKGQGVVLRQGDHTGVFLPQVWEEIAGKADFLGALCSQKAGLAQDCWKDPMTELSVFDAEHFSEPAGR